jgi:ferredoxin
MFDRDTLVITYDEKRGEPRGSRSRKTDLAAAGLGHCVDCGICVQVCPTGIDIRKGLQYESSAAQLVSMAAIMSWKRWDIKRTHRYSWKTITTELFLEADNPAGLSPTRHYLYDSRLDPYIGLQRRCLVAAAPMKVDVIRGRVVRQVDENYVETSINCGS